jgi:uncharacterized membrane protein (DUF4010 family)
MREDRPGAPVDLTESYRLALSLGLGLLVGFQREWAAKRLAGIRTFPMITLLGTLTAWLAEAFGGWVLAGGFVALAATIWAGSSEAHSGERPDTGITTEVAVLVMFAVGALVARGELLAATAVSGAVAVLLHWKRPLHDFVQRVGEDDARSVMQLVLVGLVILPALPNRSFGPFQVLNPFEIWSMVVLIVGISLGAYIAHRIVGPDVGTVVAGLLGGLISSTATTVSYARRTRSAPARVPATALVLVLASTVVLVRVLLLTAVVGPGLLLHLAPPLIVMLGIMLALSVITFARTRDELERVVLDHAPSDLRAAVAFGLLYAAVLLGIAAARRWLEAPGLYAVAALSGLTDVDAITLSTVKLVQAGRLEIAVGWRIVLIGVLANLVFKGAAAVALGHRRLRGWVVALFGTALALGSVLLYVWPGTG